MGTITIAGENIPVTQDGGSSCSYGITPGSNAFGVNGGTFPVTVTAPVGCAWTTVSSLSWVSFPNGSSGSGNGSVTIQVGVNSFGFLSGTLTIAGQPFAVSQDAPPCGGTEVNRQVNLSVQAMLAPWSYPFPYTQQLRFANQGTAVPGPISMVIYGCSSNCPLLETVHSSVQCSSGGMYFPVVQISSSGLAAEQTIFYTLGFAEPPSNLQGLSRSVISGIPGQ
jgi:hypothetical protein